MTKMIVKKSDKAGKDNMAIFTDEKTRHKKDLRTNDPKRAGYLSYFILWGESKSLRENVKSYKKRFNFN